jgi:MFS superfamily sulfate permease-like transporter
MAPNRVITSNLTMVSTFASWRTEIAAGAIASIVSLPVCVASGVLAFAPLGPGHAATGAAAGLCGAIVAGAVSALVSTSSFVITSPRVSESLLLASLIMTIAAIPAVAGDTNLIVVSVYLCVALAGLWQVVFGLAGVAKVIKFTPHPVLVGFLNGVAVLVALSQIKPYFQTNAETANIALADRPAMFLLMLGVAALMLFYPALAKNFPSSWSLAKVPALIAGSVGGIAIFYFVKGLNADLDLGPTVGHMTFEVPLTGLTSVEAWNGVAQVGWNIVSISFILAIVATMDTLLAFRTAQNVSDLNISPVRDLVAQGVANCASALAGGVTGAASPSPTMAAYRAGGRTRLTPISSALILLALGVFFPQLLAAIPSVVLSGILLAVGILLFDRWTIRIFSDVRNAASSEDRRRSIYDMIVVLIVMGITVFYSVVAGVVAGCLLAGLVFVVNMSRPIVRRAHFGNEIQSKRLRPTRDVAILRDTGPQRAVMQLEGVLFFGNADDLSAKVKSLFQETDLITLDLRGVTDIDVSGANILGNLVSKSRELKKGLLFCHVPSTHRGIIEGLAPKGTPTEDFIKHDLDAALEWMEEKSLLLHADRRSQADVLALGEIDFLAGLEDQHLDQLRGVLAWREFAANEIICREGDEGDRMWLLAKGSVSVRLISPDGRQNLRIASLARGTTIGEMSLIEVARRSATIVADEQVVCYELLRDDFNSMLSDHPQIATKLLSNLARELSRRLRRTSEDLRNRS